MINNFKKIIFLIYKYFLSKLNQYAHHIVKHVQVANRQTVRSVSLTEQLLLAIVPQDTMKLEKVYAQIVIILVLSVLVKAQIDAKHAVLIENSILVTANVNPDIMNNFKQYAGVN